MLLSPISCGTTYVMWYYYVAKLYKLWYYMRNVMVLLPQFLAASPTTILWWVWVLQHTKHHQSPPVGQSPRNAAAMVHLPGPSISRGSSQWWHVSHNGVVYIRLSWAISFSWRRFLTLHTGASCRALLSIPRQQWGLGQPTLAVPPDTLTHLSSVTLPAKQLKAITRLIYDQLSFHLIYFI